MRMMLKWSLPTEIGNKLMKEGEVGKVLGPLMETMKPEAAYWYDTDGLRGGHFVFDLADSADIPKYSEPLFMLGCSVDFRPVMNLEDLTKGLALK
jgi:hypothetical protein